MYVGDPFDVTYLTLKKSISSDNAHSLSQNKDYCFLLIYLKISRESWELCINQTIAFIKQNIVPLLVSSVWKNE